MAGMQEDQAVEAMEQEQGLDIVESNRSMTRSLDILPPEQELRRQIFETYRGAWDILLKCTPAGTIYHYRLKQQSPAQRVVFHWSRPLPPGSVMYISDVYTMGPSILCIFVDLFKEASVRFSEAVDGAGQLVRTVASLTFSRTPLCLAHSSENKAAIEGLFGLELRQRRIMTESGPLMPQPAMQQPQVVQQQSAMHVPTNAPCQSSGPVSTSADDTGAWDTFSSNPYATSAATLAMDQQSDGPESNADPYTQGSSYSQFLSGQAYGQGLPDAWAQQQSAMSYGMGAPTADVSMQPTSEFSQNTVFGSEPSRPVDNSQHLCISLAQNGQNEGMVGGVFDDSAFGPTLRVQDPVPSGSDFDWNEFMDLEDASLFEANDSGAVHDSAAPSDSGESRLPAAWATMDQSMQEQPGYVPTPLRRIDSGVNFVRGELLRSIHKGSGALTPP